MGIMMKTLIHIYHKNDERCELICSCYYASLHCCLLSLQILLSVYITSLFSCVYSAI